MKLVLVSIIVFLSKPNKVVTSEDEKFVENVYDDNFEEVIDAEMHAYIMILFYAPWCQHCKDFEPEYEKAARILQKDQESGVSFARVDISEEKQTAERYQISTLPTVLFFRNGEPIHYSGGRNAEQIVEWASKKMIQGIQPITRPGELSYIVEEENFFVVGYFTDLESVEYKIFESAYYELDDIKFFVVSDSELMKEYHQNDGAIMVMKTYDEKSSYFKETLTKENLKNFIIRETMPLVVDFSPSNAEKIFDSKIKNHFIFLSDKSSSGGKSSDMLRNLNILAREKRETMITIHCDITDPDNKDVLEFFDVEKDDCPTFVMFSVTSNSKFKPGKEVNKNNINLRVMRSFVQAYLDGKLVKHMKSAPLPSDWNKGPLKTLVASNFPQVAKDKSKNVFVLYYAPWSGQCKSFAPIWELIADKYKDSEDIVIARMDVAANDVEDEDMLEDAPPLIVNYDKGDNKVLVYKGKREFDHLVEFIETKEFELYEYEDEDVDDDDEDIEESEDEGKTIKDEL